MLKLNFKKLSFIFILVLIGSLYFFGKEDKKAEKFDEIDYNQIKKQNFKDEPIIKGKEAETIRQIIKISTQNLEKNFFTTKTDPNHQWLSVAKGAYLGQFYSRDTFVTLTGGVYGGEGLRRKLAYSIDWFSRHMEDEGYIPIWFGESDNLNTYWYCPHDRTAENGGIKQYDHLLQFMDAIWQIYSWEGDKNWLREKIPFARKAWKWFEAQTDNFLIKSKISDYCGADWADQIRRGGYSTFVEVYWYKATLDLAYMEKGLGNTSGYSFYLNYAENIKNEINKKLWKVSRPIGYSGQPFGHYVGWIDESGPKDYFELDSNAFAVGMGIADENQSKEIIGFINNNFDYLVNKQGATRVLYGNYSEEVTKAAKDSAQNGGYWYITSYFLTMAYNKMRMPDQLNILWERVAQATIDNQKEGLTEWYYPNEKIGGALNYSWSLAYPLFLVGQILGIKPSSDFLVIEPCMSEKMGDLQITFKYQGKMITVDFLPSCNKSLKIPNKEIKDGISIKWKK